MSQKALIRREIKAARERIRGRVIGDPQRATFDPAGGRFELWVAPGVDVGGRRLLEQVPISVNGPQARIYARNGAAVFLERDAQGRYQIVAPADRAPQSASLVEVDEDAGTSTASTTGFTTTREPFTFYQGETPESLYDPSADASALVWLRAYDRLGGAPENINVASDADGAAVLALVDKTGSGASPTQTTGSLQPLYRRFDATGGNSNTRSTIDFDGLDDRLDFPSAVTETTPGTISIFLMARKEAAGGGDDVLLELDNWRVLSRISGSDTWGFDQGGGAVDSLAPVGASYTLLELVAGGFGDVALYQDGDSLGTFNPAGSGLGLGSSALGGSVSLGSHLGRVAEVLVLDEEVSDAKRASIEAYFARTMFESFGVWGNGSDGFPKIRTLDGDGNEVTL